MAEDKDKSMVQEILKKGSYLLYDFEDKEETHYLDNSDASSIYIKYISPLFSKDVIDGVNGERSNNKDLLKIITDEIPYYHREPSGPFSVEDNELSSSRDSAIINVPSALQTNEFYNTWFRDAIGYIQNKILLDVYNKFRYPFLDEIYYLNSSLFPRMAKESYSDCGSYLSFESSSSEYASHLNNIINERLNSIYSLLNYQANQTSILNEWVDSLCGSGELKESDVDTQITIFKLQDIKHELLRRKYGGSRLLYSLALSSINRKGSFITTTSIGDFTTSNTLFKDKRLIRVLNLPGITTRINEDTVDINPFIFYENLENSPSLNDLSSIYYTSNPERGEDYSASSFYIKPINDSLTSYRKKFLRDNKKVIEWDNLDGLSTGEALSYIYPTLDEKVVTVGFEEELNWRTLDTTTSDSEGNVSYFHLDDRKSLISEVAVLGNAFDLSADRLLFSENSYQKEKGSEYPFITYPISGGKSISLMDYSWIRSLDSITSGKSRVQDQIFFGVQISKYYEFEDYPKGEYYFYGISYSKDESPAINSEANSFIGFEEYEEGKSKFAYLWYCTLEYDANSFKLKKFTPILISKITLKLQANDSGSLELLENEEYELLTKRSRGILPFVYRNKTNSNLLELRLGMNEGAFEDDLEDLNLSKASYVFSDVDLISNTPALNTEPSYDILNTENNNFISVMPSKNTRSLFYVVDKREDSITGEEIYRWSDPVKVMLLTSETLNELKSMEGEESSSEEALNNFYPSWKGLKFFLNPYLNFTKSSASPLRHHKVEPSLLVENKPLTVKESVLEGPSEYAALGSINYERGLKYTCNNTGNSIENSSGVYGFYLKDFVSDTEKALKSKENISEYVSIYGDNRSFGDEGDGNLLHPFDKIRGFDSENDANNLNTRTASRKDSNTNINCLEFVMADDEACTENSTKNYLEILPCDTTRLTTEEKENIFSKWIWNEESDGITICANLSLPVKQRGDDKKLIKRLASQNNEMTISYRKDEHRLYLKIEEDLSKIQVCFKVGNKEIVSDEIDWMEALEDGEERITYKNAPILLRIAASAKVKENTAIVSLVVNDVLKEDRNTYKADLACIIEKSDNLNPIFLCSELNESNLQTACFFGSLYDFRLYKEGFTGFALRLIGNGTVRENYSFSPSSYVLGYNVYRDLGVLKEVKARSTSKDKFETIDTIRYFNRSVWDSILVDMYPLSLEEMDSTSPQFIKDYFNPKNDPDIYGWVNGVKSLNDCISVNFEENVEVYNNLYLTDDVPFHYKNELSTLSTSDYISLINTTLYPVSYEKDPLTSVGESFVWDKEANNLSSDEPIKLPSSLSSIINDLTYEADINLNFKILPESNFANFYSRGSNISLLYDNALGAPVVTSNLANSENNSQNNHILTSISIPAQTQLDYDKIGYLDYFRVKNLKLDSNLSNLLRASSYYSELRIPVVKKDGNKYKVASKWDALRTLKEGTYYVTCKYPVQILPFEDNLYNSNIYSQYAYLYATLRLKVEVSGVPVVYTVGENNATDITDKYESKYSSSEYRNTFSSEGALIDPEDNRTFPHRKINIDLYVQACNELDGDTKGIVGLMNGDEEDYSFEWSLLGTNHPEDFLNTSSEYEYLILNKTTLNYPLAISREIPLFLSKNYRLPFFLAGTTKTESGASVYDASSADDDLISPIKISPRYNINKINSYILATGKASSSVTYYVKEGNSFSEAIPQPTEGSILNSSEDLSSEDTYYIQIQGLDRLQGNSEEDLDNLILSTGRSYYLLWDYEGYVSEISYTSSVYSKNSNSIKELLSEESVAPCYTLTDSEKKNSSRLVNLLNADNDFEYAYTENGLNYTIDEANISTKTSGFEVVDHEFQKCDIVSIESPEDIDVDFLLNDNPLSPYAYKAYIEYKVFNWISDSQCDVGCIYKKEDSTYVYRPSLSEDPVEISNIRTYDQNDNEFTKWILGDFYKTSEGIFYRAILLPLLYVFKTKSGSYFRWGKTSCYELGEVLEVENSSGLPLEGNEDTLYLVKDDAFIWVKSLEPHFSECILYDNSKCALGNPYSRSSEFNYLLYLKKDSIVGSRFNIDNSYYYPYTATEVPEGQYIPGSPIKDSVEVFKSDAKDIGIVDFDEEMVLKNLHNKLKDKVDEYLIKLSACNSRNSDVSGLISSISYIAPHIIYPYKESQLSTSDLLEASYVNVNTDDLYIYEASNREVPLRNNNLIIERRGLYGNNLIEDQDFSNSKKWTWGSNSDINPPRYSKEYVVDKEWDNGNGKDVYLLSYNGLISGVDSEMNSPILTDSNETNPIFLTYSAGSSLSSARYEVALNIKMSSEDNSEIGERYYLRNTAEDVNDDVTLSVVECSENITDTSKLPSEGVASRIYLNKDLNLAWIYLGEEGYVELSLVKYEEGKELKRRDISNNVKAELGIDSPLNNLSVEVRFLNGQKVVAINSLEPTGLSQKDYTGDATDIMFMDKWYNLSREQEKTLTESVQANTISYVFIFKKKDLSLRLTKAVVRKSESRSSYSGLADADNTSNSSLSLLSHKCIVFKKKATEEMLPITFNPIVNTRSSSNFYDSSSITYALSSLEEKQRDFETKYSLGKASKNSKLTELINPWVRRLHYSRTIASNIEKVYVKAVTRENSEDIVDLFLYNEWDEKESDSGFKGIITSNNSKKYLFLNGDHDYYYAYSEVNKGYKLNYGENGCLYEVNEEGFLELVDESPYEEKIYFTEYEKCVDDFGVISKKENITPVNDLYLNAKMIMGEYSEEGESSEEDSNVGTAGTSLYSNKLSLEKATISFEGASPLKAYDMNLSIPEQKNIASDNSTTISPGPITLTNETISALINCFDPFSYQEKRDSLTAITNIQLLHKLEDSDDSDLEILLELEYPPIIYRERDQHLSSNFLFKKKRY